MLDIPIKYPIMLNMPLGIEVFVGRRKDPVRRISVDPGEAIHVLNVDSLGHEEIYVAQCREDDELSFVYKIIPEKISPNPLNPDWPEVVVFDSKKTENRSRLIRRGEEIDLFVRQASDVPNKFIHGRYHLSHI